MPKGLAIMIAAGKPRGEKDEPAKEEKTEADGTSEDDFARLAFDALKDDDEDAFVEAFKGAVRACVKAEDAGEHDEE